MLRSVHIDSLNRVVNVKRVVVNTVWYAHWCRRRLKCYNCRFVVLFSGHMFKVLPIHCESHHFTSTDMIRKFQIVHNQNDESIFKTTCPCLSRGSVVKTLN